MRKEMPEQKAERLIREWLRKHPNFLKKKNILKENYK